MIDFVSYSGLSNVGFNQKSNEDYILFNDTDFGDDLLFCAIADGAGSQNSSFRPASIVCHQVLSTLKRMYKNNKDLFMENMRFFMEEAFYNANNVLVGFKLGDEEKRYNFASTLTCAFIHRNGTLTLAHAGNTRLYVIRDTRAILVTKDHTEGQKLLDLGTISEEEYYTSMERLQLYNGLGISSNPTVQTARISLKNNDVVIMSTDGIHYAYKSEAFFEILISTQTMDEAAEKMIQTALDLRSFSDNISVNVMWYFDTQSSK